LKNAYQIFLLAIIVLFYGCANIVSPTGGPKDTKPPVILEMHPENYKVNNSSKTIDILFDEYIVIKDFSNNFYISPLTSKELDYKIKGKAIKIILQDTLRNDITYNINFGNGLVDLNEGNLFPDTFKYVFSTNSNIDTFFIKGKLFNAFDLNPITGGVILLKSTNDSTLTYIAHANKNGNFSIYNIKEGTYSLTAIKEVNNNLIVDNDGELFGFFDSIVNIPTNTELFNLYLYESNIKNIGVLFNKEQTKNRSLLKTNKICDSIYIEIGAGISKIVNNKCFNCDSLNYWYIKENDTAEANVFVYLNGLLNDTIYLDKNSAKDSLYISFNFDSLKPYYNNEFIEILFNNIVQKKELPDQWIKIIQDSIAIEKKNTEYQFVDNNDEYLKSIKVFFDINEKGKYKILIDSASFIDIANNSNNYSFNRFRPGNRKELGKIIININDSLYNSEHAIIQLFNSKANLIKEVIYIKGDKKLIPFDKLIPDTYFIKVIFDDNKNKRWDIGNYKQKIQPEKIYIYSEKINLKPNWDFEEELILNH